MNILLCPSFVKQLEKIKSVKLDDIKSLLRKYPTTDSIKSLEKVEDTEVLKCYLFQKKVRSLMFLRTENGSFIPVAITRKESKKGKNIRKDNYQTLFKGEIAKITQEVSEDNYTAEPL